jgi:hypothetical protein
MVKDEENSLTPTLSRSYSSAKMTQCAGEGAYNKLFKKFLDYITIKKMCA